MLGNDAEELAAMSITAYWHCRFLGWGKGWDWTEGEQPGRRTGPRRGAEVAADSASLSCATSQAAGHGSAPVQTEAQIPVDTLGVP